MRKILLLLLLISGLVQAQNVVIPDVNFKVKLLAADVTNNIAKDLSGNSFKIDSNNDGEIQVSEAQQVSGLLVHNSNISSLVGIGSFVNLTILNCYSNNISQLDLTGLNQLEILNFSYNQVQNFDARSFSNLQYIECSHNVMTTLEVSGLQNMINITCNNNLISNIDFTGLNALTSITCQINRLSSLLLEDLPNLEYVNFDSNLLSSVTINNCDSLDSISLSDNQMQMLSLMNLTNLSGLSCDNNQLASLNLVGLNNLNYLSCSFNQLSNMDFSGVPNLYSFSGDNNDFNSLDFSALPNFGLLNCKNNLNLTSINLKNGRQQTYNLDFPNEWLNCPSLTFVCADEAEIPTIQLVLQNNSLNDVGLSTYCSFTPGGDYNTITGNIIYDVSGNGCDATDLPQPFIKVKINDGTNEGASFADGNANYVFYTQAGNFTVTPDVENPSFFNFSPANAVINFPDNNNNVAIQNFCVTANGVHPDLEVVIAPVFLARPGFDAYYKIVYKNKGNQLFSGNVVLNFNDGVLDLVSSVPMPDIQTMGQFTFNFTNLLPFENREILIVFNVNSSLETPAVNSGDVLNFMVSISPTVGDETPNDNQFVYNQTVVNACDPNDKICLEGDVESPSKIGDYLHYTINFENIGTADAVNVVVKDVIDTTKFDEKSLQVLNSSHPVVARIKGNIAEFIFENIHLEAAGNGGGGGGHGNILLKIKTRSNLVAGEQVSNKANIYFDYNAPIETDFARTTFQTLGLNDHLVDDTIALYPNPTQNTVNIKSDAVIKSTQLFDVQGRILQTVLTDERQQLLDLTSQAAGVYFVKVTTDKGVKLERIIKK
ncbi:DUF7619 domain-containing protein [Flavobacterium pedocola]